MRILRKQHRRKHEKEIGTQISTENIRATNAAKMFYGLIKTCKLREDIVNPADMEWSEREHRNTTRLRVSITKGEQSVTSFL